MAKDATKGVTTDSVVSRLETLSTEVISDKNMSLSDKVKLTIQLANVQLRAGALQLQYRRIAGRLPEGADALPLLTVDAQHVPPIDASSGPSH